MKIAPYYEQWPKIFQAEKELISSKFRGDILDIQHIGSTAIPHLSAKPIIDIAVLIPTLDDAEKYMDPLSEIGYQFFKDRSSVERLFFVKDEPPKYHLSLAQPEKFSYWKRQLLFRDYLIQHHDLALEYEALKKRLIEKYPDGRQEYCDGKNEFVQKILMLAENNKN
jgi:GrpB-like predicted nucleotidyltransferase (UPF0157 family)